MNILATVLHGQNVAAARLSRPTLPEADVLRTANF